MCQSIDPQRFRSMKMSDNVVLLDVRTPKEKYEEGSIPGHELLNFEHPNFNYYLDELDRDKTYLVYCRSGNRSKQACQIMKRKGFERVVSLDGGIQRWKEIFD